MFNSDLFSHTCFTSGNYICRQSLSGEAGNPGASDKYIIVPLYCKPEIEVFTLRGQPVKKLGAEELLIPQTAKGVGVSDVVDDVLYFSLVCSSGHQIHSYKVSEKRSRRNHQEI